MSPAVHALTLPPCFASFKQTNNEIIFIVSFPLAAVRVEIFAKNSSRNKTLRIVVYELKIFKQNLKLNTVED